MIFSSGSRILVRGAQQNFDPRGAAAPKICSKLPENCMILKKILEARGPVPQAPLDPPVIFTLTHRIPFCCRSYFHLNKVNVFALQRHRMPPESHLNNAFNHCQKIAQVFGANNTTINKTFCVCHPTLPTKRCTRPNEEWRLRRITLLPHEFRWAVLLQQGLRKS